MLNTEDVIIKQLEEQIKDYANDLNKYKEQSSKRRHILTVVAEKCCDLDYGRNQLGGKNEMLSKTDEQLRDFIISNILHQKKSLVEMINDLQEKYIQTLNERDAVAQKYTQLKQENEMLKKQNTELKNSQALQTTLQSFEGQSNFINTIEPEDEYIENDIKDIGISFSSNDETSKTDIVYLKGEPIDVKSTMQQINVLQEQIIKNVGETGLSEFSEIVDLTVKNNSEGPGSQTLVRNSLNDLIEKKIFNKETIGTPIKTKLSLVKLNELGSCIYKKLTGKKPVISEMTQMLHNHASLKHGYCIKQTAEILKEQGYFNVTYDSEKNTFQLSDNRRYVPDITGFLDQKTKTFWEVELAHHKDVDFFEKIDKATKVTTTLYFITPDKESKEKLRKQIHKYQQKCLIEERKINLIIYLGTMIELKNKRIFANTNDCKIQIKY